MEIQSALASLLLETTVRGTLQLILASLAVRLLRRSSVLHAIATSHPL